VCGGMGILSDSVQLLTTEDVAKRLQVSRKRVLRFVREGRMACVKLSPRDVRFRPEHVDQFVTDNTLDAKRSVDTRPVRPISSLSGKGGAKSIGVSGAGLIKEIRALCQS
jgi:excisionase family DNA binding protein